MCTATDLTDSPRKGDKLQVKVARLTPIGAVVRWGVGGEGIIRNHELEWGRTFDRPKPQVSVGDEFSAVVLAG